MPRSVEHWDTRIGRRIRPRDLHVLLTVIQRRSMARAAQKLAVSQPAVSKAVADLEHTLGVRLLDRSPRGVEPTLFGSILARRGLERSMRVRHELAEGFRYGAKRRWGGPVGGSSRSNAERIARRSCSRLCINSKLAMPASSQTTASPSIVAFFKASRDELPDLQQEGASKGFLSWLRRHGASSLERTSSTLPTTAM